MADDKSFSIVVCTRNRARLLEQALDSIAQVEYPADDFEVLVVDNGSSDDTSAVISKFARRVPFAVRSVSEPRVGLSAARNRAIREARGKRLFFTDDDQVVDPRVLAEHRRVAERYRVRVVQGAIDLAFPDGRPAWLTGALAGMLGESTDQPEGLTENDLSGGNMLFDRAVFDGIGTFREDLGKGAAGYSEDLELTRRLRAAGERIAYAPNARVVHVIGKDRSTAAFFRRNSFEKGYSDGCMKRGGVPALLSSAVLLVANGALSVLFALRSDEHRGLLAQVRALNRAGRVIGWGRAISNGQER